MGKSYHAALAAMAALANMRRAFLQRTHSTGNTFYREHMLLYLAHGSLEGLGGIGGGRRHDGSVGLAAAHYHLVLIQLSFSV